MVEPGATRDDRLKVRRLAFEQWRCDVDEYFTEKVLGSHATAEQIADDEESHDVLLDWIEAGRLLSMHVERLPAKYKQANPDVKGACRENLLFRHAIRMARLPP